MSELEDLDAQFEAAVAAVSAQRTDPGNDDQAAALRAVQAGDGRRRHRPAPGRPEPRRPRQARRLGLGHRPLERAGQTRTTCRPPPSCAAEPVSAAEVLRPLVGATLGERRRGPRAVLGRQWVRTRRTPRCRWSSVAAGRCAGCCGRPTSWASPAPTSPVTSTSRGTCSPAWPRWTAWPTPRPGRGSSWTAGPGPRCWPRCCGWASSGRRHGRRWRSPGSAAGGTPGGATARR